MTTSASRGLLALLLLVVTVALAACGGGGDDKQAPASDSSFPLGAPVAGQKAGGQMTVIAAGDVDSLDPGQAYYSFSYQVLNATARPLYSFRPTDAGSEPVPDLAEGAPTISDDGKTITVRIKRGIRYSPPYDKEVKAADVKYAIERAFTKSVPNGYVNSYYSNIVGVEDFTEGKTSGIAGITTPDPYTVRFKITDGDLVSALVLPVTSPVPEAYAKRYDDVKGQSTYGEHALATGPYRVTEHSPGRVIRLRRNPNWDRTKDFRPAYLDAITIDEGNSQPTVATRRVVAGRGMVTGDFQPPPAELRRIAEGSDKDQLALAQGAGMRFASINTTIKPFDNVDVRRAVAAAIDRKAVQTVAGGPRLGEISTHMIFPTMQGFEQAGGREAGAEIYDKPAGNLELAKGYMKDAGYEDGRYTGTERILMVGVRDNGSQQRVAGVIAQNLEALGFNVNLRLVSQDAMLGKFCTVPAAKVAICPNLSWLKDYDDPRTVIDPLWNPANIQPEGNTAISQYKEPGFAKRVADAVAMPAGDARVNAFASLDRTISNDLVLGVPLLWDTTPVVRSGNVIAVNQRWNQGSADLSWSSLR